MRTTTYTFLTSFEELGQSHIGVDVDLTFDFEPGEPRVMYYRDGSGYPGSSPSVTYCECKVVKAWSWDWELKREERPDWFAYLDKVVDDYIWKNMDKIEQEALDDIAGRFESYE